MDDSRPLSCTEQRLCQRSLTIQRDQMQERRGVRICVEEVERTVPEIGFKAPSDERSAKETIVVQPVFNMAHGYPAIFGRDNDGHHADHLVLGTDNQHPCVGGDI